jgi:hypothetical protein
MQKHSPKDSGFEKFKQKDEQKCMTCINTFEKYMLSVIVPYCHLLPSVKASHTVTI